MANMDVKAFSKKIMPKMNKIQKSKVVNGIMGGMMGAMPVTMLGAFASLFLNLPIAAWKSFIASTGIATALNISIVFSTNFLAVIFVFTIAGSYAKQYKEDGIIPGILAAVCFFIMTPFTTGKGAYGPSYSLSFDWLGATGIFSAIIIALITTRIYVYIKQKGWTIKMPASVPPIVSNSFSALIPGFAVMILALIVSTIFKETSFKSIHAFIYGFIQTPLQGFGGNIVSITVLLMFAQILWWFGVHGSMVVLSIIMPIMMAMDAAQLTAYSAGKPLPNITGFAFINTYTVSGGMIGFAILMLFAKSKQYKTLGKLSALPSFFGITEPLVFGTPMVFNIRFAIPFIVMNVITPIIAYALTVIGIVPRLAGIGTAAGTPVLLSGLMQGSWRIAALQFIFIILSVVVWYPFFKKADREAYEIEQKAETK